MSEEAKGHFEPQETSAIGKEFVDAFAQFDMFDSLSENESYSAPHIVGIDLSVMRQLAAMKGSNCAVFDHGEIYEIRKLQKGFAAKALYSLMNAREKQKSISNNVETTDAMFIEMIHKAFVEMLDWENLKPSYKQMTNENYIANNIVPYSALHKKVGSNAKVRFAGTVPTLRRIINVMIKENIIEEVNPNDYLTSAKLYKLKRMEL